MIWFLLWFGDGSAGGGGAPGGGSSAGSETPTETRIEVWSNLQCAGGSRLTGNVPAIACTEEQEISDNIASTRISLVFPAAWEGASHVSSGRVIRLTYPNNEFDEFRIDNVDERVPKDAVTVTANGVIFDLALASGLISETTGQKTDYNVVKTDTPTNLIDFVRGFAPTYFALGTITPTAKVAVTFDWAAPLAGLQAVVAAVRAYDGSSWELSVGRNGIIGYYLNLTVLNSSATAPDLRTGKNLLRLTKRTIGQDFANRVYPQVPWSDDTGVGSHLFVVTTVSANTYIEIDDPAFRGINPIVEDDALNGLYWVPQNEGGTPTARLITDTVRSTKRLYMSSTTGIAVGDFGRVARNSAKDFLGYVEKPSSQADVGLRVVRLTVPEAAMDNVIVNPSVGRWTAGVIDYWFSTGLSWPAEETSVVFTGSRSARMQNSSTDLTYVFGWDGFICNVRPNLKVTYRVWIKNLKNGDSGAVSWEFQARNPNGGAYNLELSSSTELTDWTAITSAEYTVPGSTSFRSAFGILFRQRAVGGSTNARWYLGLAEALIYETGATLPVGPVLGSNTTGAWLRGVNFLTADPVTYEVSVADLTRADSTRWPYDQLLLGGNANVTDAETSLSATLRIVGLIKDHLNPMASRITFTKLADRLSGLVAANA